MGGEAAAAAKENETQTNDQQQGQQQTGDQAQQQGGSGEGQQQNQQQGGGEGEGFDVVEEGATPASDRVIPLSAHLKAKGKWKQQKTALKDDAAAKGQEAELLAL